MYVIRFETCGVNHPEGGHAYVKHENGRTTVGSTPNDGGSSVPHDLMQATMFRTYEDAARVLLAWAMTCVTGGDRWVRNPSIREISA